MGRATPTPPTARTPANTSIECCPNTTALHKENPVGLPYTKREAEMFAQSGPTGVSPVRSRVPRASRQCTGRMPVAPSNRAN